MTGKQILIGLEIDKYEGIITAESVRCLECGQVAHYIIATSTFQCLEWYWESADTDNCEIKEE